MDPCKLNRGLDGPKPVDQRSDHDLFGTELVNVVDQRYALARVVELIDWPALAQQWGAQLESTTGRRRCQPG